VRPDAVTLSLAGFGSGWLRRTGGHEPSRQGSALGDDVERSVLNLHHPGFGACPTAQQRCRCRPLACIHESGAVSQAALSLRGSAGGCHRRIPHVDKLSRAHRDGHHLLRRSSSPWCARAPGAGSPGSAALAARHVQRGAKRRRGRCALGRYYQHLSPAWHQPPQRIAPISRATPGLALLSVGSRRCAREPTCRTGLERGVVASR
jgi:hypothetical protein